MYRVEDKFHLSDFKMYELENRISTILPLDGASLEDGYKISSLYFDTINDSLLADTESGYFMRDKYRIRIYNDSFDLIKLEVKKKMFNRIDKLSSTISYEEMMRLIEGHTIEASDDLNDARALFNTAIKANLLRPRVIVTYDRKAYVYEDGNVRITFDRNIRGSNLWEYFTKESIDDLVYDYPDGCGSVLEVKYDGYLPKFIAQSIETNNLAQTSNSKYDLCRKIYEGGYFNVSQRCY